MDDRHLGKEQRFLLQSLKDLDTELTEDQISKADHEILTREYSKRLSDLMEDAKNGGVGRKENPSGVNSKTWLWVFFIVAVATIAGFTIGLSSGDRTSSDAMTGTIRQSIVTKLGQAQGLFADQSRWPEAIDLYDQVIDQQPSNHEALTYRAWLKYRQGESSEDQIAAWQEVLILRPEFPDAIVFLAIALADQGKYSEALEQIKSLENIEVSQELRSVVITQGLLGEIYAEALYESITQSNELTLQDLGMSVEVALETANYLLKSDKGQRSVSAIKLFRAVLLTDPINPEALSRESLLLAQTGDEVLYQRAIEQMYFAVQENPANIEALLTRATLLADSDNLTACQDLERAISEVSLSTENGLQDQFMPQIETLSTYLSCGG